MATHPRIRIEVTPHSNGSRVFVDDVEIHGLRSVKVHVGPVDVDSIVTLEFVASAVDISGEAGAVVRSTEESDV